MITIPPSVQSIHAFVEWLLMPHSVPISRCRGLLETLQGGQTQLLQIFIVVRRQGGLQTHTVATIFLVSKTIAYHLLVTLLHESVSAKLELRNAERDLKCY